MRLEDPGAARETLHADAQQGHHLVRHGLSDLIAEPDPDVVTGAHDDLINAFAGAVVLALKRAAIDLPMVITAPGIFANGVWISEPRVLRDVEVADGTAPPTPPSRPITI
jgi:hypothetical protein